MALYEHAITLSGEVEYMWTRKLSWSSGLFFINRYGLLSGQVVLLLEQFGWPGLDDHVRRICWLDSSMFFPHSPTEVYIVNRLHRPRADWLRKVVLYWLPF